MNKHTLYKISILTLTALSGALLHPDKISAQDTGFNMRTSAAVDWKVRKGLHLNAEYELRTKNSLDGIERHQVTVGADYKVCDYFKAGLDYIYIGKYNSSSELRNRHRFSLNLTGMYNLGDWRFSVTEKLQLTHKSYDINRFQEVKNPLQLKSRFTVKYKGLDKIEPFAYFEMRNIFNSPRCSATYNQSTSKWSNYKFLGYDDGYVNRLRGALGIDWKISKHNSISIVAMYSHTHDRDIDTNKAGTKLKSLDWENENYVTLNIGYKFSF